MKKSKLLSFMQLKKATKCESMYHHSKRRYKIIYVGSIDTTIQFYNGNKIDIKIVNAINVQKYLVSMCKRQNFIFDFSKDAYIGTPININGIDFGSFSILYNNDIPDKIMIDKRIIRKIAKVLKEAECVS